MVALAVQQNRAGKVNLTKFIANRGQRVVDEALQLTKEFAEAEAQLARSKKSCFELVDESYKGDCAKECNK